jgi:hypothetical protein
MTGSHHGHVAPDPLDQNATLAFLAAPEANFLWIRKALSFRNVTVNMTLDALNTTLDRLNDTLNGTLTNEDLELLKGR